MRYLLLFAIATLVCSFAIKDKVRTEEKSKVLYIYCDNSDSTTYIRQEIWPPNKVSTGLVEETYASKGLILHISRIEKVEEEYSIREVIYKNSDSHQALELTSSSYHSTKLDMNRTVKISDSFYIDFAYRANGQIKSYQWTQTEWHNGKHKDHSGITEWDSLYEYKWIGNMAIATSSYENSGFEKTLWIDVKNGWWKKYNDKNEVIDSIYYPDPKH